MPFPEGNPTHPITRQTKAHLLDLRRQPRQLNVSRRLASFTCLESILGIFEKFLHVVFPEGGLPRCMARLCSMCCPRGSGKTSMRLMKMREARAKPQEERNSLPVEGKLSRCCMLGNCELVHLADD